MSLVLTDGGKKFTPAPEGLHGAVCIDVIDLGMCKTVYGLKPKINIRWELDSIDPENGAPFQVSNRYTASLNDKANLRKQLEAWRGRKFTAQELKGFDLEVLVGVNCQLQVIHNTAPDGKTYANVQTIVPAARGQKLVPSADYIRQKDREPKPAEMDTTPLGDGGIVDDSFVPF